MHGAKAEHGHGMSAGVAQIDRVVEAVEETLRGNTVHLLAKKQLPSLDLPKVCEQGAGPEGKLSEQALCLKMLHSLISDPGSQSEMCKHGAQVLLPFCCSNRQAEQRTAGQAQQARGDCAPVNRLPGSMHLLQD